MAIPTQNDVAPEPRTHRASRLSHHSTGTPRRFGGCLAGPHPAWPVSLPAADGLAVLVEAAKGHDELPN